MDPGEPIGRPVASRALILRGNRRPTRKSGCRCGCGQAGRGIAGTASLRVVSTPALIGSGLNGSGLDWLSTTVPRPFGRRLWASSGVSISRRNRPAHLLAARLARRLAPASSRVCNYNASARLYCGRGGVPVRIRTSKISAGHMERAHGPRPNWTKGMVLAPLGSSRRHASKLDRTRIRDGSAAS